MRVRNRFTWVITLIATILVWAPVALMLLTSAIVSIRTGRFLMDYLMPAEFFMLIIIGAAALGYVALQARSRRLLVVGSIVVAVLALALSQGLAVVTGIASGASPAEGLPWIGVLALLVLYDLAVLAVGVSGVLLLRDLSHGAAAA